MVFYGAAFVFESSLRANQNTRAPMVIAIVVMTVKTSLSILLIFGLLGMPRLGLTGAGIATLVAHGVGLSLFLLAVGAGRAREGAVTTFNPSDLRGMGVVTREVVAVALPAMGERFIMNLALLTYMSVLSTFGTAAIAAYTIGVRLLAISWTPGLAFAAAASTLVGQSLGAGDSPLARRYGGRAVRMALMMMCALAFVFIFLRGPLCAAFTRDAEIEADLAPFMLMLAVAQPFMGAHFTLGGVLRGAGDTVTPLIGAAVGNWELPGRRSPGPSPASSAPTSSWIWAALIADHLVPRLAINGAVFFRGRWARRVGVPVSPLASAPDILPGVRAVLLRGTALALLTAPRPPAPRLRRGHPSPLEAGPASRTPPEPSRPGGATCPASRGAGMLAGRLRPRQRRPRRLPERHRLRGGPEWPLRADAGRRVRARVLVRRVQHRQGLHDRRPLRLPHVDQRLDPQRLRPGQLPRRHRLRALGVLLAERAARRLRHRLLLPHPGRHLRRRRRLPLERGLQLQPARARVGLRRDVHATALREVV